MRKLHLAAVGLSAAVLAVSGCVAVPVGGYYDYGYAPYGPGYVTPGGVALAYGYGPGAYAVVGAPWPYGWGGYYYRGHGGYWQGSRYHGGSWAYRPPGRGWGHGYGHAAGGGWRR
jgi:hypothetical protein